MNKKELRNADLLTSILFALISIYICITSLGMISQENDSSIYSSAGFVPLFFGLVLLILSIILGINAIKQKGNLYFLKISVIIGAIKTTSGQNVIKIISVFALYIFILLKTLPYLIATYIFLYIFMLLFSKKNKLLLALIAFLVALAIYILFGKLAGIPLP